MVERTGLDVLLVEDSDAEARLLVRTLRRGGFAPVWERVESAVALREALQRRRWQLVIFDASTADLSALEALAICRPIRPEVPFVVLSGTTREEEAIATLRAGATDYVTRETMWRLRVAATRALEPQRASAEIRHHVLQAQTAERRRIARAVHDQFGQALTAIKLSLASLRELQGDTRDQMISQCLALVDQAAQQARDFSVELSPTVLDELGLPAALRWLVARFQRWADLGFDLVFDLDVARLDRLPFEVEITCFRIAQEALANVTRHAEAHRVQLALHATLSEVSLTISDDGRGFDVDRALRRAASGGSLGLIAMREQAELANGELVLDSHPGRGTVVRAWFGSRADG